MGAQKAWRAGTRAELRWVCFDGMQLLYNMLNPKLKITGSRDGKEIGVPNLKFNKNRNVGDDLCECEVILED